MDLSGKASCAQANIVRTGAHINTCMLTWLIIPFYAAYALVLGTNTATSV